MKKPWIIAMAAVAGMLSGCATPTVLRVPVGPDPASASVGSVDGTLKVFSAKEQEENVGFEFPYNQRTDYYIYDYNGKEAEHITDNNKGHFEAIPPGIQLPPGNYNVKALAAVGLGEWVTVPVVIVAGRTTSAFERFVEAPGRDSATRNSSIAGWISDGVEGFGEFIVACFGWKFVSSDSSQKYLGVAAESAQ